MIEKIGDLEVQIKNKIMTLKEKLETLLHYYISTRQVGHTTLLKEGTENYKNDKLILSSRKTDHDFLNVKDYEIISWKGMQSHSLHGHNKPLAIDNGVMFLILTECLEEFERLENPGYKSKVSINFQNLRKFERI